ncbi:MAG: HTH domain-containing protein [Pseudomonadota bacterium]|jgi:hypothetical protein
MATELTWRDAIDAVLKASAKPLHYQEIAQRIIADGLRQSLGVTPAATVNAQISASIKRHGASSPYVRVAKGTFAMRAKSAPSLGVPPKTKVGVGPTSLTVIDDDQSDDQYGIVTAFGMFWRRDAIEWAATPKVWGMQQIGATPVDFNAQRGVYLLYDNREVIYVGRATDRPLGKRLYEHTLDRMATRWDRFSWFGLLPVTAAGSLGQLPASFDAGSMIPALEAILVEALEPRQNRKRGDDLAAVEYLQHEDPEIRKRKVKAEVEAALNRR